jgi:hypothetical protein
MSEVYTWHREDFIEFLEETLIPDLKESGRHATAEDFETAVFFMRWKQSTRTFERSEA